MERMHLYKMELCEKTMEEASKKAGKPLDFGIIVVQDIADLGFKHTYTPAVNVVKTIAKLDKDHYPEILRKFMLINAPTIFTLFWKIFKPLLDPRTVEKTQIFGRTGYLEELEKEFPRDRLPTIVGGTCKDHGENACMPPGGLFKIDNSALIVESLGNDMSVPIEVVVKARASYTFSVKVDVAYTSIVWEWSVAAYNIGFAVYVDKGQDQKNEVYEFIYHDSTKPHESQVIVTEPGAYVLSWDNSHSRMRSKQIKFQVHMLPPKDEEDVKVAKRTKDKKSKKKKKKKKVVQEDD